jgi:hypothetical protein
MRVFEDIEGRESILLHLKSWCSSQHWLPQCCPSRQNVMPLTQKQDALNWTECLHHAATWPILGILWLEHIHQPPFSLYFLFCLRGVATQTKM